MRRFGKTAMAVMLLGAAVSGCSIIHLNRTITLDQEDFAPLLHELVTTSPQFFDKPYTLIVMLDRTPCGVRVSESIYWSQWRDHMVVNGYGFVFATSRLDSAGLAYAAHLDSADAPVLVLESYDKRLPDKSIWRAYAPFHFLIDSTGALLGAWQPAFSREESDRQMYTIDSLTNQAALARTDR